jgi:WXG100 family type VII secretion target
VTNPASIDRSAISNVAQMHIDTASNIDKQRQFVEEIIADMAAHSKGDMVTACQNVSQQWDGEMRDIYNKLQDMANLVNQAVKQYGAHDSDNASSVGKVGQNMSPVGTYLVG